MKTGRIYIGTSGWSYKHWKNIYYPPSLKATDYLDYYSKHFKIAEINTSFYHLPKIQTVINWKNKVPQDFKFCPKMSRYITHMKKLHDSESSLQKFFNVFDHITKLLGPVLIQLPPSLKFNYGIAVNFFEALSNYQKQYDFVLEIRHSSWLADTALTELKKYKIGLVISQSKNRFPYTENITSENIYLRFHGPEELYASSYSNSMLKSYAKKFLTWREEGYTIWAFFNNDIHGYAYQDADRLINLVNS